MGRFVVKGDTKIVRAEWWDADESVTVRKWTIRQKDELDSAILHVAGMAGEIPEIVVKSVTIPYLIAGIASWTFCDDNGNRVPVNEHWIGQLSEDDADFIATEIRAFNGGRSPAEQQDFLHQDAGSDGGRGEAPVGDLANTDNAGDGVELE